MSVPYDTFNGAFLAKITEYEFIQIPEDNRDAILDGYLKRAVTAFKKICRYDLTKAEDDETRSFDVDIPEQDLDEIVEIISEGMLVQWMKPYVYRQEVLENVLNTLLCSVPE